jgi:hypothetical protein
MGPIRRGKEIIVVNSLLPQRFQFPSYKINNLTEE